MIFSFIDRIPCSLEVEEKFDRSGGYPDKNGDFQDKGTFVALFHRDPSATRRTSFDGRALPDLTKESTVNGYEAVKPIPMIEGSAIPWLGKPDGGKQYELGGSIEFLLKYLDSLPTSKHNH